MKTYQGKIHTVRNNATEFSTADDRGVLTIYRTARFNVGTRDRVHADYLTVDGVYGQVCTALRGDRYYVRGPHAAPPGTPDAEAFFGSIDAAVAAAMARAS